MKAAATSSRLAPVFRSVTADYLLGLLAAGAAAFINHRGTVCSQTGNDAAGPLLFAGTVLVGVATFLLVHRLTARIRPSLRPWLCLLASLIAMAVYLVLAIILLIAAQPGGFGASFECIPEGSIGL